MKSPIVDFFGRLTTSNLIKSKIRFSGGLRSIGKEKELRKRMFWKFQFFSTYFSSASVSVDYWLFFPFIADKEDTRIDYLASKIGFSFSRYFFWNSFISRAQNFSFQITFINFFWIRVIAHHMFDEMPERY